MQYQNRALGTLRDADLDKFRLKLHSMFLPRSRGLTEVGRQVVTELVAAACESDRLVGDQSARDRGEDREGRERCNLDGEQRWG